MIVTATNLANGTGAIGSASATTASITPTASQLVLITVGNHVGSGTPATPTITGCSMTWTQIATHQSSSDSLKRITMFRGVSSSPTTGALTIDFGGQSQDSALWCVDQLNKAKISGTNGSDAIVQVNSTDSTASNTSLTTTLGAFSNINNATYGGFYCDGTPGAAAGTGFTRLAIHQDHGEIASEFAGDNRTAVTMTWGSEGSPKIIMGLEISAQLSSGFFPFL